MAANDGLSGFTARLGFFAATALHEDSRRSRADCPDPLDVVGNRRPLRDFPDAERFGFVVLDRGSSGIFFARGGVFGVDLRRLPARRFSSSSSSSADVVKSLFIVVKSHSS
jgi:hypothetical protein